MRYRMRPRVIARSSGQASVPPAVPVPPVPAPPVDRYATQIIPPERVARWYRRLVWTALAGSFALSIIGNLRLFGGDLLLVAAGGRLQTAYLLSRPFLLALLSAALYQLILQLCQFRYAIDPRYRRRYALLIALSVLPSLWTFAPLLDRLESWYKIGYVWWYGGALIVFVLNDIGQEQALQRRD